MEVTGTKLGEADLTSTEWMEEETKHSSSQNKSKQAMHALKVSLFLQIVQNVSIEETYKLKEFKISPFKVKARWRRINLTRQSAVEYQ